MWRVGCYGGSRRTPPSHISHVPPPISPISRLYLAHISPISRPYLPHISQADSAWLAEHTAAAGGGAAPRLKLATKLDGSRRSLEALTSALDGLIEALSSLDQQESAALDARADALVARASGSAAAGWVGSGQRAGEAARAARVLALRAGTEGAL